MILENPKDSMRKNLLEIKHEYSKFAQYKISIKKSVVFLYTTSKLVEREIKITIPFTIATKSIKYLRINLTKEVKALYTKNYKTC